MQDKLVDEEADETFDVGAVAVGNVGADDDVLLARVVTHQDLDGRQ